MQQMVNEWIPFRVQGQPGNFNNRCTPMRRVTHTTHIDGALQIFQQGEIKSGLVFDESKLNDKRILVSWVSPNHWNPGFRYGTCQFGFELEDLIEDKKFYWVEAIQYNTAAPRILVTTEDMDDMLVPYDPMDSDGPWWYNQDEDAHYFNGEFCLELMLHDSIKLDDLLDFRFVKHRENMCSIFRGEFAKCEEVGLTDVEGAAKFITRVTSRGLDFSKYAEYFMNQELDRPIAGLRAGFSEFAWDVQHHLDFSGEVSPASEVSKGLARAVMAEFTYGRLDDARRLARFFESDDAFETCAARCAAECLGLPNWEQLL